jgi:hypothetical protein
MELDLEKLSREVDEIFKSLTLEQSEEWQKMDRERQRKEDDPNLPS